MFNRKLEIQQLKKKIENLEQKIDYVHKKIGNEEFFSFIKTKIPAAGFIMKFNMLLNYLKLEFKQEETKTKIIPLKLIKKKKK